MTTTINASTSAGLIQSADTSAILQLQTANLPAVTIDASQNTTVAGALTVTGTTTLNSSVIKSGTSVPTTSGTTATISSIPSWVKRITLMVNGVTTTTTASALLNLTVGNATTYTGSAMTITGTIANRNSWSGSVMLVPSAQTGTTYYTGNIIINLENTSTNNYTISGQIGAGSTGNFTLTTGVVVASAAISSVTLTTSGGGNFSAGSINILYE